MIIELKCDERLNNKNVNSRGLLTLFRLNKYIPKLKPRELCVSKQPDTSRDKSYMFSVMKYNINSSLDFMKYE